MKLKLTLSLLLLTAASALAENPLVTHMYTADPTARVHEGKLFVYPSSDQVPPPGVDMPRFCMPGYHAFSLEGGSTWHDYGWILKENDVPWGARDTYAMWAPDCIEKDGKYYYYFPAKPAKDNAFRRIGVGISDRPEGPFEWEESYIEGVSGIDPGLFIDDDDQAYLFFGGGQELYGAPLSDDMLSITEKPIKIEGLPKGYKEGSFVFKKDGVYYFTFAHVFPEEGYTIGYAVSDNPLGPYQYWGKIMDNIDNGTNHHSIVEYEGRWILFYHFWHISGFNKMRSMCADYMEFKPDGSIKKVTPTLRGIGAPMVGDTIQIDRTELMNGAQSVFVSGTTEPTGWMVAEARTGATVTFTNVDFGDGTATKMQARMASGQRIGSVEVRQSTANGKLIAQFPITFTGGWDQWQTVEADIETQLTGKQNICVVFMAEPGHTKTANLNWLMLQK